MIISKYEKRNIIPTKFLNLELDLTFNNSYTKSNVQQIKNQHFVNQNALCILSFGRIIAEMHHCLFLLPKILKIQLLLPSRNLY